MHEETAQQTHYCKGFWERRACRYCMVAYGHPTTIWCVGCVTEFWTMEAWASHNCAGCVTEFWTGVPW